MESLGSSRCSPVSQVTSSEKQCCGTGTGTVGSVTFGLSGTGTVIKWNHKRLDDNFRFLSNNAASINIKNAGFLQFFLKTASYGLDTEPEPELVKSRNLPRSIFSFLFRRIVGKSFWEELHAEDAKYFWEFSPSSAGRTSC